MYRKFCLFLTTPDEPVRPLVLLNFQRWLRENTNVKFATILRRRGPLEAAFAALGETFLIEAPRWKQRTLCGRIAQRLDLPGFRTERQLTALRDHPHRLIYSNTVTNGDVLQVLVRPGMAVVTHVHELDYWIEQSGPENWNQVCRHTTKFVAASEAVSQNLQDITGSHLTELKWFMSLFLWNTDPSTQIRAESR